MTLLAILSDGFFAAVAAVGFGAVSDPPMRAFPAIALLAAVGHALRFCLMDTGVDIASARCALRWRSVSEACCWEAVSTAR